MDLETVKSPIIVAAAYSLEQLLLMHALDMQQQMQEQLFLVLSVAGLSV